MLLQTLSIKNFDCIDNFFHCFNDGINILKNRNSEEIENIISFLLNRAKTPSLQAQSIRTDTKIEATVRIDSTEYQLKAIPDKVQKRLILHAYHKNENATAEYMLITEQCDEHNISTVFNGTNKINSLRLLQYEPDDKYHSSRELSKLTDGFSNLPTFHTYLRTFIKNQKEQQICNGKSYEISVDENGKYELKYKSNNDLPISLSESERILTNFLCFLQTVEFWRKFEEIRNIHAVKKPLIIKNLLERLDESINVESIINQTISLNRQIILLTA